MKNLLKTKIILLFLFTLSCERKVPDLIIENIVEGFVDLTLHISEMNTNSEGNILITTESKYQQQTVGFQIEIIDDFKPYPIGKMQNIYWGKGYFINTGKNTEKFITLLTKLYSVHPKPIKQNKIPIALTYLSGDPRLFYSEPVHTKFFFNSDSDDEKYYAEVFINIDANKKTLEFHEKDEEYRSALINSLCGK